MLLLQGPLSATMNPSSVSVPYTSIDLLLNVLAEHRQDPYYHNVSIKRFISLSADIGFEFIETVRSKKLLVVISLVMKNVETVFV